MRRVTEIDQFDHLLDATKVNAGGQGKRAKMMDFARHFVPIASTVS
jgi:hypothetical protein